jgi:hypothetical protein
MITPSVRLAASPINRMGLITDADIPEGTIVWHPSAACAVWKEEELNALGPDAYGWVDEFGYRLSDGSALSGADCGYAFNHSCDPNVLSFGVDFGIAVRNIAAGGELTIDYRTLSAERGWRIRCSCGAADCARDIHATQVAPEPLQASWTTRIGPALALVRDRTQPLKTSLTQDSRSYQSWLAAGDFAFGKYSVCDPRSGLSAACRAEYLSREMRRLPLASLSGPLARKAMEA